MKEPHPFLALLLLTSTLQAADLHVSKSGDDSNEGSQLHPFKSISKAAEIAQPGDIITVHEGIYRERINPPRGGTSDDMRIVYQAAPGEKVTIKGSERVTGWEKVGDDVWKVDLPNRFFGDFNPYSDLIQGDWYEARQPYHTGAVYLNGHWLKEAARKSEAVKSAASDDAKGGAEELMNIERINQPAGGSIPAASFMDKSDDVDVIKTPEGKTLVGRMKDGSFLAYEIDFGENAKGMSLYAASPLAGGIVELHKDAVDGDLIGRFDVGFTAEWTHTQVAHAQFVPVSGKHLVYMVFKARPVRASASDADLGKWFAEVNDSATTIWADFKGKDPNQALVEINVRQTVFYPEEPGRNYITVRGFTLEQAATPWSPPTAVQVGLVGTHWSRGWVIENNTIQYSACSGVTLGKHGDEFDNTYNYYRSIRLGLKRGWNRETIGGHLVRNNHIQHCGQGGIIGSLGPAFSTIIGNEIHDIRKNHQYGGCETAGIKLHGGVDVIIKDNHIYNCEHWGGIWIDWMGQGARVTGNLLHDNSNDLMFEMNHGPMLIDNNILLSGRSVLDASGGGAYVHNLILGVQSIWADLTHRKTPIFEPHSTDVLPDPPPVATRFGALGGRVAHFNAAVENTEQDAIYQTVRCAATGYRLEVPNGSYRVTLKFNEPFYEEAGQRRFGAMVQGKSVVEGLDVLGKVGKNQAFDVVAEQVLVEDGVLSIGFIRDVGAPCIAGIEVVGTRDAPNPYALRINCGGPAWEAFQADSVVAPKQAPVPLLDQPLTDGFGVTVDQHDDRFINNVMVKAKTLAAYDEHPFEIQAEGNVFLAGSKPSKRDRNAIVAKAFDPGMRLSQQDDGWWLEMQIDPGWQVEQERTLVTSERLGRAKVPDAPFENRDGTPYRIDTDYFGEKRSADNPAPGPFRVTSEKPIRVKVWPKK